MLLPGSSSASSAFPRDKVGRRPASPREHDFPRIHFEAAAIPLCSGLRNCLPSRSFPPLQISLQGGQGFYVRAERASSPSHASDILSARLQAIGGTRTFTSQDSQYCRLLPTPFSWGFFHPCSIPGYPGALESPVYDKTKNLGRILLRSQRGQKRLEAKT